MCDWDGVGVVTWPGHPREKDAVLEVRQQGAPNPFSSPPTHSCPHPWLEQPPELSTLRVGTLEGPLESVSFDPA